MEERAMSPNEENLNEMRKTLNQKGDSNKMPLPRSFAKTIATISKSIENKNANNVVSVNAKSRH